MRKVWAQARAEVLLTLRRGESVLLALGIPVVLLAFFSTVDVLDVDVDFLAPGVLALAVMSTAMVSLGIATGFERQYLVLLLLGGMVVPVSRLPGALRAVARALPAAALSDAVHGAFSVGAHVPGRAWLVLAAWAVLAPLAAAFTFRWE